MINAIIPYGQIHPYSERTLNNKYLSGQVIDLDSLDVSDVNWTHNEMVFGFRSI